MSATTDGPAVTGAGKAAGNAAGTTRRTTWVAVAVVVQMLLVPVAVFGQLSARLTGDEYTLRVGPVDPIDPFRGAYVALSYPDLQPGDAERKAFEEGDDRGELFISLVKEKDVMVASAWSRTRPGEGVYLACDDSSWQVTCGIESLFLPQDEAARVQKEINQIDPNEEFFDEEGNPVDELGQPVEQQDSGYVATVKVDGRGHAAVVALVKR